MQFIHPPFTLYNQPKELALAESDSGLYWRRYTHYLHWHMGQRLHLRRKQIWTFYQNKYGFLLDYRLLLVIPSRYC